MRHAIGPRRELGQRTIFNLLGPLTNPAAAGHQLMGVYDPALTETLADVLWALGSQAAYVVHGADGLDELSTTGVNCISALRDGVVATFDFDPAAIGPPRARLDDLLGGAPEQNAAIAREVLGGYDRGPGATSSCSTRRRRSAWSRATGPLAVGQTGRSYRQRRGPGHTR